MTKVSVVVPVFNGQDTLARALESLRAQTMTDWEALVIDDGSTDRTAEIARGLAQKDARIRYEALPRNRGVSAARNRALDKAEGEWITPLDADDWYEPQRLEKMLEGALSCGADAVLDELLISDHATGAIVERTRFCGSGAARLLSGREVFEKDTPFSRVAIGYARPLIRRDFLRDKLLRYDERFHLGEDFLFLAEMVLRGGRVFTLPFAAYVHVRRLSPTTGEVSPFSRSQNDFEQIARGCEILRARYEEVSGEVRRAMNRRCRAFGRLARARRLKLLWQERDVAGFLLALARRPDVFVFVFLVGLSRFLGRYTGQRLNGAAL